MSLFTQLLTVEHQTINGKHEIHNPKEKQKMSLMINVLEQLRLTPIYCNQQEAQLMLTTGSTRLAVSRGQQT